MLDGWTVAVFAGVTIVCGIFDPLSPGMALGLGMALVAIFEFIGAAKLRRLHPGAARMLGLNQLLFAAMLSIYALWNIHVTLTTPASSTMGQEYTSLASQSPDAAEMIQSIDSMGRTVTLGFYGLLIAVALFVQGGTALYYFTRAGHVREFLRQTPQWIVELHRSGVM